MANIPRQSLKDPFPPQLHFAFVPRDQAIFASLRKRLTMTTPSFAPPLAKPMLLVERRGAPG
jgi:hypothetical protein